MHAMPLYCLLGNIFLNVPKALCKRFHKKGTADITKLFERVAPSGNIMAFTVAAGLHDLNSA